MKAVDFNEAKAERNGEVTPKHLINLLSDSINKGETNPEVVLYVCKLEDGTIDIRHSDGYHTDKIGLLEIAKTDLIDDIRD
ncbi:hypothetical protein [Virgibacillus sp. CBA3643]|uniref:hypothetical protein n=1 Tax=Virgibacillus sp. CBA3643 TaxID=2942278 RepID=UPI0035A30063